MMARPRHDLSREDQVLLCGAHPSVNAEQTRRLAWLLAAPLDWPTLIAEADRHGLVALVYDRLSGLSSAPVPEPARRELAHRARLCLARNLRLRHELIRLLGGFNRAGIPVMPLKGPVLADQLYIKPLLRPMADLDLLVRGDELVAAEQTLRDAGYAKLPPHEQGAGYHLLYTTEDGPADDVIVELHWGLGEPHVAGLDVREIWAAAAQAQWEGCTICTMALPHLFLYLCLHAAKDGLASLRCLLDITLLVEREREWIPWPILERTVHAARIRTPVYLSLLQSRDLLEAPVPLDFLASIRPVQGLSWHIGRVLFAWRGGVLHVPPDRLVGPVMAILMLLWEDAWTGKLRHLRRNLIPAPELRARWLSLRPTASALRWYPAWIWLAGRTLLRQLVLR